MEIISGGRPRPFKNTLIFAFLALVCFSLYYNCLHNGFLFDEQGLITDNPYIQDLRFVPQILLGRVSSVNGIYRPALLLVYSIVYSFWNLNPFWYHFTSIAFYVLNAFLIFIFVQLLFRDDLLACLCAVLFAVHPLHSKEVAIVADMPFLLECAFLLLSVILSLRYMERRAASSYLLSLMFFIFAVFSRESGLLIPFAIVLSAIACGADKKKAVINTVPFFLLGAAYFLLRQTFLPLEQLKVNLPELLRRIPPFFYYCHKYIRQLIAMPYGFVAGPLATKIINFAAIIGPLLFYAAVLRLIWLKDKIVIFGCLFFLLAISPLLNLIDKIAAYGPVVFDHYVYLASLGVILIFAYFFRRLSVFVPKIASLFFILAVLFYSGLTVLYTHYYKNEQDYYRYILSFDKNCAFAHAGLANIYYQRGMLVEAENEARQALYWRDKKKISLVYATQGPYTTLGSIYAGRGDFDKSIEYFRDAININPEHGPSYANLALVYVLKGSIEEAQRNFQQALRLDPANLFTLKHFSRFLEVRGRYPEAIDICERILELRPDDVDARIVLAEISYRLGRLTESEIIYKEALSLNPNSIEGWRGLGLLYITMKKNNQAIAAWQQVLKLLPDDQETRRALEALQKNTG